MTWDFYIADPADPTYATKLVDFMDFYPGGTGFNVADGSIDLGSPSPEQTFLHHPPTAGGILATSFYPEVEMTFRLLAKNSSYDALLARLLILDQVLQEGGTIVWKPNGASVTKYIDFYPSPLAQFFRGQNVSMQKLTNLLMDPDGLEVHIMRFPLLRGAPSVIADAVNVSNGTLDGHIRITNPGNAESPVKLTIEPTSASAEFVQVRAGRRSGSVANLDEFETLYQFDPTEDLTTLPKQWRRVWKEVISPSDETGLVGNFRVLAQIKLLDTALYRFQLKWGNISTSPMGAVNELVELDNTDYAAWNSPADVDFGKVRFDDSGNSLTLEMWAIGPDNDSPQVNFNTVTLMPADELYTNLTVPGFRSGRFGREEIYGTMWDTNANANYAHLMNDDTVRLYKVDGYAEYNFGVLPEGQHIVAFHGHLIRGAPLDENPANDVRRDSKKLGEIRILENGSTLEMVPLRYVKGHAYTQWDGDRPKRVIFDADGTSTYKVKVIFTDNTGLGRRIMVHKAVHWFMPFADNGRQMVSDAYTRETYLANAAGDRWLPLHNHGGMMRAAPGVQDLVFRLGVSSHQAALHDADARGPLSRAPSTLSADVTVEVTPYYTS